MAIEEIALLMDCTVKTVNTKWTSLKNQYSMEKRNMTGMRTGSGANDIYTSKWYGFKEMESVMDGNKPKQTYNNLSESSSSLPMPRPQSTPTLPLFQPPSTTTPLLRPPNAPTPPPLWPPNTPTPPILRPPNSPAPPLLQLSNTPTPPLQSPPIPPASTKRKKNDRNTVYKEAMETIKTIREDRATRRNKSIINKHDDDITAYGLYIAAQIRMFRPILQSKLKLDIQTLLYKYEMENINYRPDSSMSDHSDYYSENQNTDSPMFSNINTTDTQVSNVIQKSVPNTSTFQQPDNSIASSSSFRQLDFKHIQMSENSQPETTPSKNVIVISNDGSLKESVIPELRDNSADLPGLPQIKILQNEIINKSTTNTPTQMDGTLNDSLQPKLSENSSDLPGLPQIVILRKKNTPDQKETETRKAIEYLLKFKG